MTDEVLGGADWRTDLFDIHEYLDAIGVAPECPSIGLLERLNHAHVHTFPFANVDVLLGSHPGVAPDTVQEQLVRRRRGGYCFEHSQIFAAALEHLGFVVRRAFGRVHSLTNNRSHMSVTVEVDGRWWLCDPGFGFSVTGPIELADGATRREAQYTFAIERGADEDVRVWKFTRDGTVQHYVDELPVHPVDVRSGHFVTSRNEHSGFKKRLVVARFLPEGHVTLTERHRTLRIANQDTEQDELTTADVIDELGRLGVELRSDEPQRLAALIERLRND